MSLVNIYIDIPEAGEDYITLTSGNVLFTNYRAGQGLAGEINVCGLKSFELSDDEILSEIHYTHNHLPVTDRDRVTHHHTMQDITETLLAVLNTVGESRIQSAAVGQSPLRRTRSVTISETRDGEWRAEEDSSQEEGVIVYVVIKYHRENSEVGSV